MLLRRPSPWEASTFRDCSWGSLEQIAFPAPAGTGAVNMAVVAAEALQILVASAAVVRVGVRVVVAVAGAVVQTVGVAAAVAHLSRRSLPSALAVVRVA